MRNRFLIHAAAILCLTGCTQIGPQTLPRDRFDYNTAIADSWKEQTLLNIVKLRYADMPLFLEVASVVSGYTLEGAVSLGGTVSTEKAVQGNFLSLGTSGKYTDRPTITYAPITGAKFNESFMTPIPPKSVLFLLQSGWPADVIFPIVVDSINGLRSRRAGGASQRQGDSGYYRFVALLRKIQDSGAVGMRILKETEQKQTTVLFFYRKDITPEIAEARMEIKRLLGLDPEQQEISVTYGLLPETNKEMAMLTRSLLQIMLDLATQINVPPEHVADGRTIPSLPPPVGVNEKISDLIQIKSGRERPINEFAAVKYENTWFWIDKTDFRSKRTFAFLMILFSLTETGGKEGLPLVTIPSG